MKKWFKECAMQYLKGHADWRTFQSWKYVGKQGLHKTKGKTILHLWDLLQ